jgi:hypothetical protein
MEIGAVHQRLGTILSSPYCRSVSTTVTLKRKGSGDDRSLPYDVEDEALI